MSGGVGLRARRDGLRTALINDDMVGLEALVDVEDRDAAARAARAPRARSPAAPSPQRLLADWRRCAAPLREGACRTTCAACSRSARSATRAWRWPVTDPRGFLQLRRRVQPYRPVDERLRRLRRAAAARGRGPRARAGAALHGLRRAVLPHRLPARQPDPRLERPRRTAATGARRIDRLHATNNFPEFTGKLCPAPCEEACVLALNDDAVTIKQVEQAIVDRAWDEGWVVPQPPAVETGRTRGRRRLRARPASPPRSSCARAGPRRDGVRARRPRRRPAALRHPRLQVRQGRASTAASSSCGRGRALRDRRRRSAATSRSTSCATPSTP